jgi:hypothetical protein
MDSLRPDTDQEEPLKPCTAESEDVESRAQRLAADRMVKEAIEGLNRLAREKAAANKPDQAA